MADNTSNSTLTTDFNVPPYYDDFDDNSGYYRILFRPGYAVQARELTQPQTMLQNQVARFGKHIFREGSIVLPGQFSIETNLDYVKIKDVDASNNSVSVDDFDGETIYSETNGVVAQVIDVADGSETSSNTKTLFIRYTSSSSDGSIDAFQDGENLTSNNGGMVTLAADSTGQGSRFVITEGVVFAKDHFIRFPTSSIILSRYSTTPNCRVGFTITEDIIRYTEDQSLLDPALESSNYAAPGADRLKLTAVLDVLDINDTTGAPDFVELFTIQNGIITELYERPQYNILRDEMAKRTFDESGDYYVKGLTVRVRENLDTGNNFGYSTTGNSQLLSVGVEPGVGYVKGYEVGKLVTTYVTTDKATTYENVNSQIISTGYGNYLTCNEFTGSVKHDEGTKIILYDTANQRLTNRLWADGAVVGTRIGEAKLFSIEYDSGILGTAQGNVNIYLTDVQMNGTNSFSNTRSLYLSGATRKFGADVVLSSNIAALKDAATSTLLYSVGTTGVRTIRDGSAAADMTFNFKRTDDVTISSGGTFSVSTSGDEVFPYGTSSDISDADKADILVTIAEDTNIALPGTVSATATQTALSGSSTFFTRLNIGDKLEFGGNARAYFITAIADNTNLTVDSGLPSLSGDLLFKAYKEGDVVNMTGIGSDAGTDRTIATTSTQLTFDLKETFGATKSASVTYQISHTSTEEVDKDLRANRFVIIDCSTAGTTGPFNLGFPDVYKIRKIRLKTGSTFSSEGEGTDVLDNFIFDNGQRDQFYDFATITPKSPSFLGATDFLLVKLDWFEPSFSTGRGYFSVDSYPIDDDTVSNTTIRTENIPIYTSPTSGTRYNLRNYIDFRPAKVRVAADATTVGGADTNPGSSEGFTFEASGLRLPAPSTQATFDYSFYYGRRDLVVMDKEGNVSIVKGIPRSDPRTPLYPENFMVLASIYIAPYPSLAPNYAQVLKRLDISCSVKKLSNIRFTMRDIGVLKNRIINLEYYAALSLLEKSALDMQIIDEDGLNRFKNGIFVDTFSDHTLGDIYHVDYRIVVDPSEKSIRPIYTMDSLLYNYKSGSNVVKTGDLITLPYSNTLFVTQNVATSYRNIELSSYRFIGELFLTPDTDVWVDTEWLEDEAISIGPDGSNLPQNTTTWNEWQTKVVGYVVDAQYNGTGATTVRSGDKDAYVYGGTFSSINHQIIQNPNSPRDQRVTQIADVTRTGTQTSYSYEENTVTLGTRVVDVSLIPYIRDQVIRVNAKGLKANTRVYAFFDGEDMNDYTTPLTQTEHDNFPVFPASNEGDNIVTNSNGECWVAIRLAPEKKFRVGTKEVILTDSPTNSQPDASTYGIAYFVSHGLLQQKQESIYTTREVIASEKTLSETSRQTKQIGYLDNPSCIAYSVPIKAPEGEEGVFMTKVDIYIAAKHPTLGMWVEIREMNSAGGITRNQVPFSEVWVDADDIVTSSDASTPHTFVFPAPVFLYNNTEYAFLIHTVGINPDTYIWISRLGETNLATGEKHNSRPLTGTLYTTNNNLNWDIVPDVDLKITFYRAAFDTEVVGSAVLGNKPFERLLLGNTSADFTNIGEGIIGYNRLTLTGNTGSIANDNILICANTGANGTVINDSATPTFTVANNTFETGERVMIYSSSMVDSGLTSVISSIDSARGILSVWRDKPDTFYYNEGKTVDLINSNGDFFLGDTVTGMQSGETATVDGIRNLRYSVIDLEPAYLDFVKTYVAFEMQTTSNTEVQGQYFNIGDGQNYFFNTEQAVLSRSREVSELSSDQSNKVRITMSTETEFLSPVVDVGRTHSVYVNSIINSNTNNETNATGGALINKYISLPVTLAEDQDAEDMVLVITAYRPPETDVKIWVKILNVEDGQPFTQTTWIELAKRDDTVYSSLANRNDFREFTYDFPVASMTGPNGEVQYTNNQGITATGYKYFAIKVGLINTANNSAVVPRVADLRAIALQM